MSKSNPRLSSPVKKFIEFKGDTGIFYYYDKEQEKNIELKMPLYFVVLDELCSIKGYNGDTKSGIYSNEVRYIKDETLNVRTYKGSLQITGRYNEIKDKIKKENGKFCKSVYAMLFLEKDKYELVNFSFYGASFSGADKDSTLSGWVNCKVDHEQYGVVVKECEDGQVGSVKFKAPIFTKLNITKEVDDMAIAMDRDLQIYLASYLNSQVSESRTDIDEDKTDSEIVNEMHNNKIEEPPPIGEQDDLPF